MTHREKRVYDQVLDRIWPSFEDLLTVGEDSLDFEIIELAAEGPEFLDSRQVDRFGQLIQKFQNWKIAQN